MSAAIADGLLAATLLGSAQAATAPITVTADISGNQGRIGERYTWTDAAGRPTARSASTSLALTA